MGIDPRFHSDLTKVEREEESKSAHRRPVNRRKDKDDDGKFRDVMAKRRGKGSDEKPQSAVEEELPDALSLVADAAKKKKSKKEEQPLIKKESPEEEARQLEYQTSRDVEGKVGIDAKVERADPKKQVEELFKLVTDRITEMKHEGKTETSLVLKHPPLFAGAKLTLKTQNTAKGEFNITFSELNPEAKTMLDLHQNREALVQRLQEKGYVLHIFVATTETETSDIAEVEESPFEREEKEEQEKEKEEPDED